MRGEAHLLVQTDMSALAHPCQRRRKHFVVVLAQQARNRRPLPAAAPRSVHDDERAHRIEGYFFLRTAIIGSAADTVTVAVESASSSSRLRTSPSERRRRVGFDLQELGRQADLVEDVDERLGVELLDVDHCLRVPPAVGDQQGGGDRRHAGGVADPLRLRPRRRPRRGRTPGR